MTKRSLTDLKICGDCGVEPGATHQPGCDVERCPGCGWQRIQCDDEAHMLMPDGVWTGIWPGVRECQEFGWYARYVPNSGAPYERRTTQDDPRGEEDLNRLSDEAACGLLGWDRDRQRWDIRAKAPASITCPRCLRTSHNPHDVREKYCGNCHKYHPEVDSSFD